MSENPKDRRWKDGFAPSLELNRTVKCLHCGDTYPETEAIYGRRARFTRMIPNARLWWCRNKTCDGAGVGFDLIPISEPAS